MQISFIAEQLKPTLLPISNCHALAHIDYELQTATGAPVFTTQNGKIMVTAGQQPLYVHAITVPELENKLFIRRALISRKKMVPSRKPKQTLYQFIVHQFIVHQNAPRIFEIATIKMYTEQTTYRPHWPHL